jgi:GDP-mannose pyrophosphatase NudK
MAGIKIKEENILWQKKSILKEIRFERQKKNGEWEEELREVFNHGNAVSALLYNKEAGTIILTKQLRIATYVNGNPGGMLIETPAGLLEEGEAPETAIIREIKEETGYALTSVKKVYEAYSSAGAFTELLHLYIAPYSAEQKVEKGGGLEEEGEELRVMEMPFSKAMQMMERGEIKDAKTILLLLHAKAAGLL